MQQISKARFDQYLSYARKHAVNFHSSQHVNPQCTNFHYHIAGRLTLLSQHPHDLSKAPKFYLFVSALRPLM